MKRSTQSTRPKGVSDSVTRVEKVGPIKILKMSTQDVPLSQIVVEIRPEMESEEEVFGMLFECSKIICGLL